MNIVKATVSIAMILIANSCLDKKSLRRSVNDNLKNVNAAFVMMDLDSDEKFVYNEQLSSSRLPPCSTFKIWNTLIGAEGHLLVSPDQAFYWWDGKVRAFPDWNQNLTLSAAFRVSCVPAFQNLARQIGPARMQQWIDLLNYGNRDISSGIDDFWLPQKGKHSIRISPLEQASLLKSLFNGLLPFSESSTNLLFQILLANETAKGKLYGKTGSGDYLGGKDGGRIGWYVGYVLSHSKRYAFACLVLSNDASGALAKTLSTNIFKDSGLL